MKPADLSEITEQKHGISLEINDELRYVV